jgi:hypothetical protein
MTQKLSLKPAASFRSGEVSETGPTMVYEVEGLPDTRKISIRNVQAAAQQPIWQIGAHTKGYNTRWTGTFESASEALTQLQEQIDSADEEPADLAQ